MRAVRRGWHARTLRALTACAHGTHCIFTASSLHARYLLYGEGAGDHEDSLLLVDSGFVSVYLGFVSAVPESGAQPQPQPQPQQQQQPQQPQAVGRAATSEEAAEAASQVAAEAAADVAAEAASARLRLAKVGPGFMLNVGNFVGRRGTRAGSEVAVADTFTQLLRLSRARFDLPEARSPANCTGCSCSASKRRSTTTAWLRSPARPSR